MLAASGGPIGPTEAAARGVFGPVGRRAQLRSFRTLIHVTFNFRRAPAWTHVELGSRQPLDHVLAAADLGAIGEGGVIARRGARPGGHTAPRYPFDSAANSNL